MNVSRECEELKSYKRNKFNYVILDDDLKATIRNRWKKQFDVLGYSDVYPLDQFTLQRLTESLLAQTQ